MTIQEFGVCEDSLLFTTLEAESGRQNVHETVARGKKLTVLFFAFFEVEVDKICTRL